MKRNLNNVKRMTSHPIYQYCKCQFGTSPTLHVLHILFLTQKLSPLCLLPFLPACVLTLACVCVCGHGSDMTGAQDGSVRMFEWKRPQQLICFRQAGNARVTRLYFNSQGNKVEARTHVHRVCFVYLRGGAHSHSHAVFSFSCWQCGVADGEGFLSLWQVNQTSSNPKPYLVSCPPPSPPPLFTFRPNVPPCFLLPLTELAVPL